MKQITYDRSFAGIFSSARRMTALSVTFIIKQALRACLIINVYFRLTDF